MTTIGKVWQVTKSAAKSVGNFVGRNASKVTAVAAAFGAAVYGGVAQAQTDATVIATNAQTAFAAIAPITITIVGFYVILKLAKRTVK